MKRAFSFAPILRLGIFTVLFSQMALAEWGNPAGFFQNEKIKHKKISSGLEWWSVEGELNRRPLQIQIVTVDTEKGYQMGTLLGESFVANRTEQRFLRSSVSRLHTDNRALAAINASFFDIATTETPYGFTMSKKVIYREPSGRDSLLFFPDGQTVIGHPKWKAQISAKDRNRPLAGVNKPSFSEKDEVILYQYPWSESPGNSMKFTRNQKVTEVVVQQTAFRPASSDDEASKLIGRIVSINEDKKGIKISKGKFVLTATESAAPYFRHLKTGDELTIRWQLNNFPAGFSWHKLEESVSAGPVLVEAGKVKAGSGNFWTAAHPRSAIAIHKDRKKQALVLVDGRSFVSFGISLGDLANFLVHLGAEEALNLDGGGSSAITIKRGTKARVLNTPSDGDERLVPTGIGIFSKR